MTTLYLVRHAANNLIHEGRLAGWLPDVHINEEGHQQAEQMAKRMEKVVLDAIYASPLERAIETAEYLARPRGIEIIRREGLGEIKLGEWEGGKIEELAKTDAWRLFQILPSGSRPPGGEQGRQLQARAVDEVETICAAHPDGTVAIVSHADTIKAIIAHYAGIHLDLFQRIVISPASVSVIWMGMWGPRLLRLNDAGPLEQVESPKPAEKPEEKEEKGAENAAPGL